MTYILQDHCVENKQYCVRAMQKQESKEGQQLGDYSRNPSEKDAGGLSQ